jgi:hypothetical protein
MEAGSARGFVRLLSSRTFVRLAGARTSAKVGQRRRCYCYAHFHGYGVRGAHERLNESSRYLCHAGKFRDNLCEGTGIRPTLDGVCGRIAVAHILSSKSQGRCDLIKDEAATVV